MFKIGDEVEFQNDRFGSAKGPYTDACISPHYKPWKGKTGIVVKPTDRAMERSLISVKMGMETLSVFPWRLKLLTLEANE